MRNSFLLSVLTLLLFSCATRKDIVYVQDIERAKSYEASKQFEPTLQPDDLLGIIVTAENAEVTAPFNLPQIPGADNANAGIKTYLIDNAGYVELPVLGKVKLGGLTRTEANNKLVSAISEYIRNPTVTLRILNYKISVLGEVAKPNTFNIQTERVTFLEALALAGDVGVYGKRDNILLIRETDGKKSYVRVDITKSDFLDSPYFYLAQNDVIYVEPNKTKIKSSSIGPDIYVMFSGISLLTTIVVILLR